MKSILFIILFSTAIILSMYAITWDVDWRMERLQKRAQVNSWLCERALNEYKVSQEWTR